MQVRVKQIDNPSELQKAHEIRFKVFVAEQKVPPEAELDEFEDVSRHFIAYTQENEVVGTARWRFTEKGVKLERFAVEKNNRGKGIGSALVSKVLQDISQHPNYNRQTLYLHAQLDACPLYAKFGFIKIGEMFEECDIKHYKMIRNQPD